MKHLWYLIKKDLALELKGKDGLALLFGLILILCLIASFGVASSFLGPQTIRRIYPAFLWVIFIFTATISISRCFERDFANHAISGLRLAGISLTTIYASKVVSTSSLLIPVQLFSIFLLAGFLDVDIAAQYFLLALVSILVIIAYSSLATLLSAISISSRIKGVLLPLILLPLLFPLLAGAIELSIEIMMTSNMQSSTWLALLTALDIVYFVLGLNLFEFVISD